MTPEDDLDRSTRHKTDPPVLQKPAFLVNDDDVSTFQNELSVEIIKLIRAHLHKAQITGSISAEISDRLLHSYITDLKQLEQGIQRKVLQERLQTLERMQEQLVHAYQESLGHLQTEIQQFKRVSSPNEVTIHRNKDHIPQTPRTMSEPHPVGVQRIVPQQPIRDRYRNIQRNKFSALSKYVFPVVIISALTAIGIRFGMTIFMATGSLMIGGTLIIRFIKK